MTNRNRLLTNYGWVQNTSNLSTIRDTIDLVPEHGIRHLELREAIKQFRESRGNLPRKWTWDARCRIKAMHALGLVSLDRHIQGYQLTDLGRELKRATMSASTGRRDIRGLTNEEIEIFKRGLLTNPPVIRVLTLLNNDRLGDNSGLSKYDIGMQLGFVGDIGFTHIDPYWVVSQNYSFNDKEGDSDKWARTILSWLTQVGWVVPHVNRYIRIVDKRLQIYTVIPQVEDVLRYSINSTHRNVPSEMLCSGHHAFPKLVQKRRIVILCIIDAPKTLREIRDEVVMQGIHMTEELAEFEIINLRNAGFRIDEDGGYYKLKDRIVIDDRNDYVDAIEPDEEIENLIEEMVVKYDRTIPPKLIDHLIRYGYNGSKGNEFEGVVAEYFRFLGYETDYFGQGRGRVTDVIAKWKHPTVYAQSYGVIMDAKSSSSRYAFPANDKRKMKEYIQLHGPQLMSEQIPRHAFSFISSKFVPNLVGHLQEIQRDTHISGCAIPITTLLDLGDKIIKQEKHLSMLYDAFTTNNEFDLN